MWNVADNPRELAILASVFGIILCAWVIAMLIHWRGRTATRQRLEHRLGLLDEDGGQTRTLRLWRDGQEAVAVVPDEPGFSARLAKLRRVPQQAGLTMPFQSLLLMVVGVAALAFVMTFMIANSFMAALAAPAVWLAIVWVTISVRVAKQTAKFERQLVDALQLIARSLRAGHPLPGAFHLVAEELDAPINIIFAEVCEQQQLGVSMEEALRKVAASSLSDDFKFFATSVAIQIRAGGNLADMMDRSSAVIRDRIRLAQRVKILTAQTQYSKRILLALPVFVFALLNFLNPSYMRLLYDTKIGLVMTGAAVISMTIGTVVMNQLAKLRY